MAEKIVITATGLISALGIGEEAHIAALRAARSGLRLPQHLLSIHAADHVAGEVRLTNDELADIPGVPKGEAFTRTTLLAMAGIHDMLQSVDIELLRNEKTAFINANTVGGMCTVENMYMQLISDESDEQNNRFINSLDSAESTQHVAAFYGLKPLMATISTACSSSANSIVLGARMIRQGVVKRAICGGCDSLSRFTMNGFLSLKNVSKEPCKPFDQNRAGLNLGEGAGYLLLESETSARERGAQILGYVSGYCNSNDAYHATAPSPDGAGALNTMRQSLLMAGLQPHDIGYINAHGTATANNDLAEGLAVQTLFGSQAPPFSSTKPFTGHTLAAAGVIEAIFSIWAMRQNITLPNLNFSNRMEELAIAPETSAKEIQINHVLSNSFGFGGSNVSLIFSKA